MVDGGDLDVDILPLLHGNCFAPRNKPVIHNEVVYLCTLWVKYTTKSGFTALAPMLT